MVLQLRTSFPGSTFGSHFGYFWRPCGHLGSSWKHFGRGKGPAKNKAPKTSKNDAQERAQVAQKASFWRLFGSPKSNGVREKLLCVELSLAQAKLSFTLIREHRKACQNPPREHFPHGSAKTSKNQSKIHPQDAQKVPQEHPKSPQNVPRRPHAAHKGTKKSDFCTLHFRMEFSSQKRDHLRKGRRQRRPPCHRLLTSDVPF